MIKSIGRILTIVKEIEAIDINPLLVFEKGCKAVDLRIMLIHKKSGSQDFC